MTKKELTESEDSEASKSNFIVDLGEDFNGPFDVLLSLIAKHKLDITHISLSKVTDEFVQYVKDLTKEAEHLEELSQFVLIAATLLDIKTARLLPGQKDFDEEDLELLETRDLLFAKLLQYKAFKDIAYDFQAKFEKAAQVFPRDVPLEEKYNSLLPDLIWNTDTTELAMLAAAALTNQQYRNQGVNLEHIHLRQVNVAEQGAIICKKLSGLKKGQRKMSFSDLISDTEDKTVIIGRFLSLLELYKMNAVIFVQKKALGDLVVDYIADESFDYENRLKGSDFDTPVTAKR
ncbi:MAG: segregation/condensation protein A [Candidatus Ancillula sp.]|jgi:segregation and condensation protein A|nr:segregation/condensation protein A [Candidatus Ancillula sp.]